MNLCGDCVTPLSEEIRQYLPPNSTPFHYEEGLCNPCYTLRQDPHYEGYVGDRKIFSEELEDFLGGSEKLVFAYSGGLDSTVALDKLNPECKKRGIELICFAIDHGFKGAQTMDNIRRVMEFEGLDNNFFLADIKGKKTESGESVFDYYVDLYEKGILPCGPLCNPIVNRTYKEILNFLGEDVLVTGGDTPKFRSDLGRYSIFWQRPEFMVMRGGAAFNSNKVLNRDYVLERGIPWEDPGCGGYDTDCLIPGAVLRKIVSPGEKELIQVVRELPVVIEYFSERVRWGVINREQALAQLSHIEVSGDNAYKEFLELISNKASK